MADRTENPKPPEHSFNVVGIGASAGGLEEFKKVIKAIPLDSGMAYVFVQHLQPDHPSVLPEILQRETSLPVVGITDNVELKPDHIFVIPTNKMLVATDGILKLTPRPAKDQVNRVIDSFFISLAEVHQSRAIGVILSGTGFDGTAGLKWIKDAGGMTIVQDPDTAVYSGMPANAIRENVADFVVAPEKIPGELIKLQNILRQLPETAPPVAGQVAEERSFDRILILLRQSTGVDFKNYKQTTIRRRVLRRLAILKIDKIEEYLEFVQQNKAELAKLFQEMLIPVTGFFRDRAAFDHLCQNVFPEIIKDKSREVPVRVWVAGCSTGEEAYSMAICLYEYLTAHSSTIKVQIFATDLSERVINKARAGIYENKELGGLTDSQLQQYFLNKDGSYVIKKPIRDMCVFATHNFLKDPPFSRMDLVSCRNVLIYFEQVLQKKAFQAFHYALNEKSFLFLGKSESIGTSAELFVPMDKTGKVFFKNASTSRITGRLHDKREETMKDVDYGIRSNSRQKDDFQRSADAVILSRYSPVGVVIDARFEIVQFRGATGVFLEPSPGKASFNLLKMAKQGLSFEIRNAVHKATTTNGMVRKERIPFNDGLDLVTLEVIPLPDSIEPHFLILFQEAIRDVILPVSEGKAMPGLQDVEKDNRIMRLEQDLMNAREDMRSISENQEAANEELQSTNEELLSGSEELQSLNEELETSKEELQSTNEELVTVNQELLDRNDQLNIARLFSEAIVATIHEPLLILNTDFFILNANAAFYKAFNVSGDETINHTIFSLHNGQWDIPELRSQLTRIQHPGEHFLEWEVTFDFPTVGTRTICFNAQPIQKEKRENWILLAMNDVTLWKERENLEKRHNTELTQILGSLPLITFTADRNGTARYFNQFFFDYSRMPSGDAFDRGWQALVHPAMQDDVKRSWEHSILTGDELDMEVRLLRAEDQTYRWHHVHARSTRNEKDVINLWVCVATDLHDQKHKEQLKDEFISIASHELKTPLTTAKAYVELIARRLSEGNTHGLTVLTQKANASINRLNSLVNELLDVSKIQNGKLALNKVPFDFNEMMRLAAEGVQLTTSTHHIDVEGTIKEFVFGDSDRLQQVVINLLTNSIKYSPTSSLIKVRIERDDEQVKVSVSDTGIGIRRENLEKIFERYYREEGRVMNFQGMGIGLSISSEIVKLHNGRLWAESQVGEGSTFLFTVPL